MPKGFTIREKEVIRQRLLDAGYRQFSTHGLKKTNIEELAAAARISKGAFYLFYESKEALFMDVAEVAEQRFRQEILTAADQPGSSPRARLHAALKRAFGLLKTIPILQFFRGSDFDLLFRRIPPEKLQEHMASDQKFFTEFIAHCRKSGIPIRVRAEEIRGLLYPLVLAVLHRDELEQGDVVGDMDGLLELVAACCLGEVEIEGRAHARRRKPERGSVK